jgi:predicted Fe-S protein YdhL (DUF1289 family)
MAIFPKIQSPCPYLGDLSAIMDGDMCRVCKRQVFDLTGMSDDQRVAFMKGCSGEVCVSYRLPVRPALVAAALAVAAIVAPTAAAACSDATDIETVETVGAIKDPANVQYVKDTSGVAAPVLPVVYEGGPSPQTQAVQNPAGGNGATPPVSSRAGS